MNGQHPASTLDPDGQVAPASTNSLKASPSAAIQPAQSGTVLPNAGSTNPPPPAETQDDPLAAVRHPKSTQPAPISIPSPPTSKIYPFQFADLKEGDLDPTLGNKIKWLISSDDNFIVYISEDHKDGQELYVEWNMNDCTLLKPDAGAYLNRVGQLEAVDIQHLSKTQVISYKRMIAEGVARLFDSNFEVARNALVDAELWILARNTEVARRWYLAGASWSALLDLVVVSALIFYQDFFKTVLGPAYPVITGGFLGGIGAWLSVVNRSRSTELDVAAGKLMHHLVGAFRIIAGKLGAAIVSLAIHAGLLTQVSRFSAIMTFCIIAGASERLVPSFIEQMELRASGKASDGKVTGQKP